MARYFFNVQYGKLSLDKIGEDLPDDTAAWHEATLVAGEMFKDIDGKFQPGRQWDLEVTNEQGEPLYLIRVSGEKK
jgi:uncharacterized protein DUF6894